MNKKFKLQKENKYKNIKIEPTFVKRNKEALRLSNEFEKELYLNHNHSWYQEIKDTNKNRLYKPALFYRGSTISYEYMLKKMEEYASKYFSLGVTYGTEIPVCASICPELIYTLGAASILGAKLNIFGEDFGERNIKEIIKSTGSNLFICTDDLLKILPKNILDDAIKKITFSLNDSLPNNKDPYIELDYNYRDFENHVDELKSEYKNIISKKEFESIVGNYQFDYKATLDDEFSITYSSGSTGKPKPIVHTVKSFIAMGRWHDTEISDSPDMSWMTVLSEIYAHSNTGLICSISDGLLQGCKLALEPIHDKDFFINSLLINKPNYAIESRSFWLNTFKKIVNDENYKKIKMPYLTVPFSVGEPLAPGEEKFCNKVLRKIGAGKEKLKLPISLVSMSVAGGDCEHGGIFFVLFRSIKNKMPYQIFKTEPHGMGSYKTVEYAVLDENGKYCKNNETGRLVANSICTMKCYKNNDEATEKFFLKDKYGKVWGDCNAYATIDNHNFIQFKSRISNNKNKIEPYEIMDVIALDTKNVLSCETITALINDNENYFVAHIEPQPDKYNNIKKILISSEKRCLKKFGPKISSRILFCPTTKSGIPIAYSGKRDTKKLIKEGITDKCIKPILINGKYVFVTASNYINREKTSKQKVLKR